MVFKKPEDLEILKIPAPDLSAVKDLVDFGPTTVVVKNLKRIQFTFTPTGNERFFFGYQLLVTFRNKEDFSVQQSYPIEDIRRVIVDFDLNSLLEGSKVILQVKSAQGQYASLSLDNPPLKGKMVELGIDQLTNKTITVEVEELKFPPNPPIKGSYQIRGKLISNRAEDKLEGYQVVIYAATSLDADANNFTPVAFATTEANGYFLTNYLIFTIPDDVDKVKAAKAIVAKDGKQFEQPIRLVEGTVGEGETAETTSRIPERLILVISEDADKEKACMECGCGDLKFHEKKVLEEYSYYTVVRTTEPSIIANVLPEEKEIDLEDIYGVNIKVPIGVFQKYTELQSRQIKPANFLGAASFATTADIRPSGSAGASGETMARTSPSVDATAAIKSTFNKDLLNRLLVDYKVKRVVMGNERPVFRGRTPLSEFSQISWDYGVTLYQAGSIAHGHILQFKQEWIPDGYSIGDLVYSLPLAPGQKKQIAVVDWERRESAANSQFLDYEETLNNSLIHDRDIREVVEGTLTENIRARSRATTAGIGFGLGGAIMGVFTGGAFGGLLGVSGGKSSSGSTSSQNSSRESTANSLQSIKDRTSQSASAVRSQRSTVIQTVSQGERVQATAESVANYNHCHAITIQYFEVLRHFMVRTRLAGVQECLFVPLQIAPFDIEKCLRWRNALESHIYRPELRAAFDAVARVKQEKESPFENYYDSIGFPRNNFAEQEVKSFTGDLYMEFTFFNTMDGSILEEIISFYRLFGISLDAFKDRKITDEELARHVGPRAIEYLLDCFTVETDKGVDLKLDLTLLSSFRQNSLLRISIRQSPNTPVNIPRNQIEGIKINLDLDKLSPEEADNLKRFQKKYMKIRVRSGNLRYTTAAMTGSLFEGRLENDIFAEGDGVFVRSLLTKEELRNPRGEDVDAVNNLLHHLNENLEYYHKCIFFSMTPERRFMLLDGIVAPGKANGRSVASVVENRVMGVAGNSLIMPVAPGFQLDPTIDETFNLFAQYYDEEKDPMRISMPTKGIYAEAVIGECNSCEEKDEHRFWRWEESPIPDSPNTQILPLNTDTRRAEPGNLQPKDFPSPMVNIQNAPALPDPTALQNLMQNLGKSDVFRDLTGLTQNQLNALAAFKSSLETAQKFGEGAQSLAGQAAELLKFNKLSEMLGKGQITKEEFKDLVSKGQQSPDVSKLKEIKEAVDKKQITPETGDRLNDATLKKVESEAEKPAETMTKNPAVQSAIESFGDTDEGSLEVSEGDSSVSISKGAGGPGAVANILLEQDITGLNDLNTAGVTLFERISEKGKDKFYDLFASNTDDEDQFLIVEVELEATDQDDGTTKKEVLKTRKSVSPGSDKLKIGTKKFAKAVTNNQDVTRGTIKVTFFTGDPNASIKPATTLFLFPFPLSVNGSNEFECSQPPANGTGAAGNTTHVASKPQNRFAVDFSMPIGTEVFAMQDGVVVAVEDSNPDLPVNAEGKTDPPPTDADEDKANTVRIRHADGTFSNYVHLKQNSVAVAVGDTVKAGVTKLGLSGNSGFSTAPHLHVVVLRASHDEATNNSSFVSLAFKFRNTDGKGVTPGKGKKFKRA